MTIDLSGVSHHPAIEEPVDILCNKTQNSDRHFYRASMAYFLAKIAGSMRAMIVTKDRGNLPVNIYAILLAPSGYGKGHSTGIIEDELLSGFRSRYVNTVVPTIRGQSLQQVANRRAIASGRPLKEEVEAVKKEFNSMGPAPFTFDSGTVPAIKQLRDNLLLSGVGAINLQIDEIGSNLVANTEVLNVGLELYDRGKVKQKLTKVSTDNQRSEDMDGMTPTNMLLYGTPSRLLDGGLTEEQFFSFLDTGYARRCIFASGETVKASNKRSASEIYQSLVNPTNTANITKWNAIFSALADPSYFEWEMQVEDKVGIALIEYRLACEAVAEELPEYEDIRKAEISHRYFKALKLAGALAFVDSSQTIDLDDHLLPAILLVEESGEAFQKILTREKPYVRLAKLIAAHGTEMTHPDILERFPSYGRSNSQRNEMFGLASAWGHKNGIALQKIYQDGQEFIRGKALEPTDLSRLRASYSNHFAYHYENENEIEFDQLDLLAQTEDLHWCNHHFREGHRLDEKAIPGFNMIVVDVDGTARLETVHELLKEYTFMTYTTKRHRGQDQVDADIAAGADPDEVAGEEHRFRLIIPMNYVLELDQEDYREFMNNVLEWLPFESDEGANQRARKWLSHPGTLIHKNQGTLLDVRNFIPKTTRNETYAKERQPLRSFDNVERWFAGQMQAGNRNNLMIRYALTLFDNGVDYNELEARVLDFNKRLADGLSEDELRATVLVTAARKYTN